MTICGLDALADGEAIAGQPFGITVFGETETDRRLYVGVTTQLSCPTAVRDITQLPESGQRIPAGRIDARFSDAQPVA